VNVNTSNFSTTNVTAGTTGYITTNQTPNPTYVVNNNLKWTVVSSSTQYVLSLVVTKVDGPNKYEVTIT
jgi:VCBS repeat-containing protein